MSKFGEIIDKQKPVMLVFFSDWCSHAHEVHPEARDLAATFGNDADVIKIDVEKNKELSEALRIKGLPTYILYKNEEMKFRESGKIGIDRLTEIIKNEI